MHGYGAADIARSFRTVRANTIKIAEEIPADQYSYRPADGTRTIAEVLAHVALSPRWQQKLHSQGVTAVDFSQFASIMQQIASDEAALAQSGKDGILESLRNGGEDHVAWLAGLSDATLAERVHFPPPVEPSSKTRFEMLLSVKEHEMHHRAQLMVIERLIGITPHLTREMQARMAQMQQTQSQSA